LKFRAKACLVRTPSCEQLCQGGSYAQLARFRTNWTDLWPALAGKLAFGGMEHMCYPVPTFVAMRMKSHDPH
ncbi:MAG: hypothetical protein KDE20_10550, partial [Caldilineaceae bacterium]|nr:hypothetical protein [Caldilineaceae bacterium]